MECDDEDNEEGSDDEYSDDDDVSWKVRRAAAKCLEAVIVTRHEMMEQFYTTISPALINRFKEREENVKADIFHAYQALLKQTKPQSVSVNLGQDNNSMEAEEGPVSLLQAQVPNIVKALHRQMKEKSIKTRQGCFALLTELILVLPGALATHMEIIIGGIQFSLGNNQNNSNMKIDTLSFIQCLLAGHHPTVFHPHAPVLVPAIINAVSDSFYKISSEALVVLQLLVKVLRPLDSSPTTFDFTLYTNKIYQCCFVRLKAQDIDQEVKERAISCMGQIVAHLGDSLQQELGSCLPIFLERLKNEITRLTAVKALISIASSPLRIDLRCILSDSMPVLSSFLRKNQRALKLSTLVLLDTMVKNYSTSLALDTLSPVLAELPPLVSETDLHIAQLTLTLLTSISMHHRQAIPTIQKTVLPEVLKLAESPLLQGAALAAMLEFFKSVVSAGVPGLAHNDLLALLVNPVLGGKGGSIHKQGRANIAKCVASLVSHSE